MCMQAARAPKAKGKGNARKRKKPGQSAEDTGGTESSPEPKQPATGPVSCSPPSQKQSANDIVSSSAYMLLYKKRDWHALPEQREANEVTGLPARCIFYWQLSFDMAHVALALLVCMSCLTVVVMQNEVRALPSHSLPFPSTVEEASNTAVIDTCCLCSLQEYVDGQHKEYHDACVTFAVSASCM